MFSASVISVLARSFLAGELTFDAVHARVARTLGRKWGWLRPLALRYVWEFERRVRPRHRDVIAFLQNDPGFRRAGNRHRREIHVAEWLTEPARMQSLPAAQSWNVPNIETVADLADWLSLYPAELEWFADLKRLGSKSNNPKLQHYCYRVLTKQAGGIRLIESPKSTLKAVQRRLLSIANGPARLLSRVSGGARTCTLPHTRISRTGCRSHGRSMH